MNKKKIIVSCLMIGILLFIGLKKQSVFIENELARSNIEALASNENGNNYICIGVGSLDCPVPHSKVAFIREF